MIKCPVCGQEFKKGFLWVGIAVFCRRECFEMYREILARIDTVSMWRERFESGEHDYPEQEFRADVDRHRELLTQQISFFDREIVIDLSKMIDWWDGLGG